jgi:hypothetical protein
LQQRDQLVLAAFAFSVLPWQLQFELFLYLMGCAGKILCDAFFTNGKPANGFTFPSLFCN